MKHKTTRRMVSLTAVVFAAAVGLAGCTGQAEQSTSVNGSFVVDELFTHKGCTAFRFKDNGNFRYYTVCDQKRESTTMIDRSCGKGCSHKEEISTNHVNDIPR